MISSSSLDFVQLPYNTVWNTYLLTMSCYRMPASLTLKGGSMLTYYKSNTLKRCSSFQCFIARYVINFWNNDTIIQYHIYAGTLHYYPSHHYQISRSWVRNLCSTNYCTERPYMNQCGKRLARRSRKWRQWLSFVLLHGCYIAVPVYYERRWWSITF